MSRPSFQFYTKDWRSNSKLRRCSPAARGVWMDILCALHDSDEYGIARYPLKELANEVGASLSHVRELVDRGVLKGSDSATVEAFVYVPRSGRKDGEPVTLVPEQRGPLWYSSRMVKDEHVRKFAGAKTRFGSQEPPPCEGLDDTPSRRRGEDQSDGLASSSSSAPAGIKAEKHCAAGASRFEEFWAAWPHHPRKRDRKVCAAKWKTRRLDAIADVILANVKALELTDEWKRGFIPLPETYLNNDRWADEVIHAEKVAVDAVTGQVKEWHETASGITKQGASLGVVQDEGEHFQAFRSRVYAAAGHVPQRTH